jgi:hypothetical protein
MAGYLERVQWAEVHRMLRRVSADGTEGAVLYSDGEAWFMIDELPRGLTATAVNGLRRVLVHLPDSFTAAAGLDARAAGGFDFEESIGQTYWFCRILPLIRGHGLVGYLAVAQDWTNIDDDVHQQMLPPGRDGAAGDHADRATHSAAGQPLCLEAINRAVAQGSALFRRRRE